MPTDRNHQNLLLSLLGCLTVLLAAFAPVARAQQRLTYPTAARSTVAEHLFGTTVADPYRWLEDLDSPATRSWVAAEAKLTAAYLNSSHARAGIRARVAVLYDFEKIGIPFQEGGRYFYTHNTGLQDQSVLFTTKALAESAAVALDPNALSANGSLDVVGYVASRDGSLLAYGVSISGSDWTEWHVRNVATGKDLPDILRHTKYYPPVFSHDGAGLYYSAFPAPPQGQELSAPDMGNALYYHLIGTSAAADRAVYEDRAHPSWQFAPHLSSDGRWLVIAAGDGEVGDKGVENLYLLDLATHGAKVRGLAVGFEAAYDYVGADAGSLFILTTLDAPRGRVIAIDPTKPEKRHWQSVIAEGGDAIDLTEPSVTLVDHQIIVRTMHDARSQVTTYGLDGALRHAIPFPGPGTAHGFGGLPNDQETFYSFTDLITPSTIYRYDLESGQSTIFRAPKLAFDPSLFEERQVFYPAKDGTKIPLLLAYRKGVQLNGQNPLLLYGYGGFGVPILPAFSPSRIAWMEMGGIYAIANIRGGGEYGEAWHRQAIRAHKQIVFDDFIAAAEWLIAQRYTSTKKLAILGGSNGGLLVGACVTQRPDLFGAAVAEVGVMDMLRFDRFGQGAGWVGDYGSPHDRDDFKALYAYSPVHNVRPDTHYPATLVITGDHDTRVMPMHSFKFAAALQAAQTSAAPVLLDVELSSGHGGGTTVTQAIDQNADIYAFLSENLGMHVK